MIIWFIFYGLISIIVLLPLLLWIWSDKQNPSIKLPQFRMDFPLRLGTHVPSQLWSKEDHDILNKALAHAEFILPVFQLLEYEITMNPLKKDVLKSSLRMIRLDPDLLQSNKSPKQSMYPIGSTIKASTNWCGAVWRAPDLRMVSSTWRVQAVQKQKSHQHQLATQWVGLGGCPDQPLIQAGTDGWMLKNGKPLYKVWFELIQPHVDIHPFFIKNFPIEPEDVFHVAIDYQPGPTGSCRFFIWNVTKKKYTQFQVIVPGEMPAVDTAEWIVEKVAECPLAKQELAFFSHAAYNHEGFGGETIMLNTQDPQVDWYQLSDDPKAIDYSLISFPHPEKDLIIFDWQLSNEVEKH